MASGDLRWTEIIFLLLCIAHIDAVEEDILSYNASTKQLHFRCPAEKITSGKVLYAALMQQEDVVMANWTTKDKGQAVHERMHLLPTSDDSGHVLEAVLDHVTCHDVNKYTCSMIVRMYDRPSEIVKQSQIFTYEGEVMDPVLKVEPLQARYNVGDQIELTCSARIGSASNNIVWESRLPEGTFELVSGEKNSSVTEKIQTELDQCSIKTTSSVMHILTAEDDSREWRCRLNDTDQNAIYIVNVMCTNGKYCSEPCQPLHQDVQMKQGNALSTTSGQEPAAKQLVEELKPETTSTVLVLIAVISVLFIAMVICVVAMTAILKKQTKKQIPPLVITPPPSDYNVYSFPERDQPRNLPLPPCDNPYDLHDDDRNAHRLDELDDDETPPKVCSMSSSSVYISMSVVPSLHESTVPNGGGEELGKRDPKSDSMYSNQGAVVREATRPCNLSSASHDSHVTMGNLKGWM